MPAAELLPGLRGPGLPRSVPRLRQRDRDGTYRFADLRGFPASNHKVATLQVAARLLQPRGGASRAGHGRASLLSYVSLSGYQDRNGTSGW